MKRALLVSLALAVILGGGAYAYGAVTAKLATVKVINVAGDYANDFLTTTIPGTTFNAHKGPAQIHYTFMATGGTYPALAWANTGNFTYSSFRVSCTDGTDGFSGESGVGVQVISGGYCELTGAGVFTKAVTISLAVGGHGAISNIDGALTQAA